MTKSKKKLKKKKRKSTKRTPPCDVYPEWTTGKFWSFVRGHLRRMFMRWPPKYEVLKEAQRPSQRGDRTKWEYQCKECEGWFPQKEVDVDHIVAAGSLLKYEDLPQFVERLLPPKEGLQVLCKQCHKEKTAKEK